MAPEQNQPERPECQNSSIDGRLGSVHKFSASLPFRWDNSEIRFTLLSAKIMKDFETGKRDEFEMQSGNPWGFVYFLSVCSLDCL